MITIKAVTLEQLSLLAEISRQTFMDTFAADNSAANMQDYLEGAYGSDTLRRELQNPKSFFYFACDNKKLLAYLKLNIGTAQSEEIAQNALEIERIYVKKEYKHQGIGTLLFQKALEVAKEQEKSSVWLGVWEKNDAALNFYKKLGFEAVGEHVFQLGDDPQRDIIMQKKLLF